MFKFNQLLTHKMLISFKTQVQIDKISLCTNKTRKINNLAVKLFSNKENYKDKFRSFAKQHEISPEEAKKKKESEEMKLKDSLEEAKKLYEEESKKKKELFEKIKRNEPIDNTNNNSNNNIEIDISMSKIKEKFSSVFSKIKISSSKENNQSQETQSNEATQNEINEKHTQSKENQSNTNTEASNDKENLKAETQKIEDKQYTGQDKVNEEKLEKKESIGRRFLTGFIDVWNKTFPGEENIESRFEKRKEEARVLKEKIKDATEEEIQKVYTINKRQKKIFQNGKEEQ